MHELQNEALTLRRRLKDVGLSDPAIKAAWPTWWSEDADASPSAVTELRFSVARKLGLDPRSLLSSNDRPRFVWHDEARFKHLTGKSEEELDAITSFGTVLGTMLVSATDEPLQAKHYSALDLRAILLGNSRFIGLGELLSLAWSLAIPVVHLRVFPSGRKRMAAMVARSGNRNAIMLAKDSMFPAAPAFYLAHEIAHVNLGHLRPNAFWLDVDIDARSSHDEFEVEADQFALELLTGYRQPKVLPTAIRYTAKQVAVAAIEAATLYRIEPGIIAMCFGYTTGRWRTATAALPFIYNDRKPAWIEINKIALTQLNLDRLADDTRSYVTAILGDWSND
jgi:hypothetical protein